MTAGVAGLVGAKLVGSRIGRYSDTIDVPTRSGSTKQVEFLKEKKCDVDGYGRMYRFIIQGRPGYDLCRLQKFVKNYKLKNDERWILAP